jgi:RNA polymerase sigma-70 factor (ECF subfamily)
MLASLHDAEDALQETLLRAWRGLPGFKGKSSARTWLHQIATNACLDALRRRKARVLPMDFAAPVDAHDEVPDALTQPGVWIDPYPDHELAVEEGYAAPDARYERREAVELAFIAAVQLLPARQRAVLVLRDVLGFSASEAAATVDSTVPAVNSALQRARKAVSQRLPDRSQQATLTALGDGRVRDIVDRFVDAFEHGEVDAILDLLTDDATFAMPPYPGWSQGREEIAESWLIPDGPPRGLRYAQTWANGQVALGTYRIVPGEERFVPIAIDVLALRDDGLIHDVHAFRTPELFPAFGLPAELTR